MNQPKPKILLHSCCGPCLTSVHEKLSSNNLTIFWYNPNIEPKSEHYLRLENLRKLATIVGVEVISDYNYVLENSKWHKAISGLENEPEGGKRCYECFKMRLTETANNAKKYDYFTTTLTVSPHKNSKTIISICQEIKKLGGTVFWNEDFKKGDGYLRSLKLSKEYDLYRQEYCGCAFSRKTKDEGLKPKAQG